MTEQLDLSSEPGWEKPTDSVSFRLVMDGVWASIHLHDLKPDKGMTREQAALNIAKWFPKAELIIEVDENPPRNRTV